MEEILVASGNKVQFINFVKENWMEHDNLRRLGNKTVYITNGHLCCKVTSSAVEDVPDLTSSHEEADTRLMLHIKHAASNGMLRIVVAADDTDVLVLLIACSKSVSAEVYMKSGHGGKSKVHSVSKLAKSMAQSVCDALPGLQPHQIWNMDETGLQLDLKAKKIVAAKGSRYLHMRTSGNREMITIIGCVNAAGKALPPHIIPKGKTTKALNGFQTQDAPEGAMWTPSDSGWTKQGITKLWFENTFLKNIGPDRPQLLILDGHDSHNFMELIDLAISNNIEIV